MDYLEQDFREAESAIQILEKYDLYFSWNNGEQKFLVTRGEDFETGTKVAMLTANSVMHFAIMSEVLELSQWTGDETKDGLEYLLNRIRDTIRPVLHDAGIRIDPDIEYNDGVPRRKR